MSRLGRRWLLLRGLLLSAALALALARPASAQSDLATVKARMLADAVTNAGFKVQTEGYYGTDFTQVQTYLSSLPTDYWIDDVVMSTQRIRCPAAP